MPPIAISCGEPAGIGPDIVLALSPRLIEAGCVAIGDPGLLEARARSLGLDVALEEYAEGRPPRGALRVSSVELADAVQAGVPNPANVPYVLDILRRGAQGCLRGEFGALVTTPVQKAVINAAGYAFSGHTEFLAKLAGVEQPVMMLAAGALRVALVTTHLPLKAVAAAITSERIERCTRVLTHDLRSRFAIARPRILVCGLNPHAGEHGHLGTEEREIISPALDALRAEGIDAVGPLPADTAFTVESLRGADAVLAMYHDQGLPVLKHAGFGRAVNITLGLPFIRTSVDHGTALALAGSGKANPGSLSCALDMAQHLVRGPDAGA